MSEAIGLIPNISLFLSPSLCLSTKTEKPWRNLNGYC